MAAAAGGAYARTVTAAEPPTLRVHIRGEIGELLTGTGPVPGRADDREIMASEPLGVAAGDLAAAQGVPERGQAGRRGLGAFLSGAGGGAVPHIGETPQVRSP